MTPGIRMLKKIFLLHTKFNYMTLAINVLDNVDN